MRSVDPRPSEGGVKLMCTAGPKAGQEFPLGDQDVVIGRATDNAISIPDTSVSRKHLKLRRGDSGWIAVDLGSGNGTLLNGEPITEETQLGNGDILALGDTEFTFLDAANSTDRREVPVSRPRSEVPLRRPVGRGERVRTRAADPGSRKKRRGPLLAIVFLAVLVGVSLAGLKLYKERKLAVERDQKAQVDAVRAQISSLFQDGKNLVRQGRWVDAKAKFEQVKEVAPEYPGVQDYLDRASKEIPNQVQLNAAEAALKDNKLADAIAALAKVSETTQQFEKRKQLKDDIDRRHAARMAEAEDKLKVAARVSNCNPPPGGKADPSKYQEVVSITDDILVAFPDDRDAKTMNEDAKEKAKSCEKPAGPVRTAQPKAKDSDEATRMFMEGDGAGALQVAQGCAARSNDCRQKATLITEFMALYKKLEDLDAKGLSQLLALDKKITEGRVSKLGRNAGTKAANIFYRSAAAAKTTGSWARAGEFAEKALASDPNHAGARALVEEMRVKAKEMYLQAYANMHTDPDDAAAKFKDVIAMTPDSDEYHRKAQQRLQELGK